MTAEKYEDLDDEYEGFSKTEKIQSSTKPVGSLTDNVRKVKPNRDGAHKRVRSFEEK